MQTADTSNLFQSDAQHAKNAYRAAKAILHAKSGDPIQLGSKPLRVVIRQKGTREADAWVGESGFVIRRVRLESGKTKQIYRGHTGPVTSLDFYTVPSPPAGSSLPSRVAREVLISGSWDKSVRVWDVQTKTHISTTPAHTDFVKALVVIPSLQILVTGSSDKDLRIWDLSPLPLYDFSSLQTDATPEPPTPAPLVTDQATPPVFDPSVPIPTGAAPPTPKALNPLPFLLALKGHTRPIENLAFYQVQVADAPDEDAEGKTRATTGSVVLISVDSLGALKTWELWRGPAAEGGKLHGELRTETKPHEIGIYDLVVGDGEIWTASADNSVLLSTFSPTTPSLAPTPTLRLPHPSGVKSLLPLPLSLPSLNSPHLLTGSADEVIRIFNLSSLEDLPTASSSGAGWIGLPFLGKLDGLEREVEGHAHDVMQLGVFTKEAEGGRREAWIVSASLDGTLRRWRWPDVLRDEVERKVVVQPEEEEKKKESLLTEEEERELEELMGEE